MMTSEADLERIIGHDIILRKAYEELNQYYWTKEELATYEEARKSQLDAKAMLDASKAEGKAEGRTETLIEVAKTMLAQGMDIKTIIVVTRLSEAEIRDLKEKEEV